MLRLSSVVFGVSGAPLGSTPTGAGRFSVGVNGIINVAGLDLNTMIRNVGGAGNGSYTMSCWMNGCTLPGTPNQVPPTAFIMTMTLKASNWSSMMRFSQQAKRLPITSIARRLAVPVPPGSFSESKRFNNFRLKKPRIEKPPNGRFFSFMVMRDFGDSVWNF